MKRLLYLFSASESLLTDLSPKLRNEGIEDFVGIAYGKNKVFNKFNFTEIIYLSDLERKIKIDGLSLSNNLANIETNLGITISSCIHADRHLMKKNKAIRLKLAYKIIDEAINLINKYNIDVVFSANAADLTSFFISEYCKFKKIRFIYPIPSRIGDKLMFANSINNQPINYKQRFQSNLLKEKSFYKNFVKEYIANKQQPSYVNSSLNFKLFSFEQLKDFFILIYRYLEDPKALHLSDSPPKMIYLKIQKIARKFRYDNLKKSDSLPKKYFIFPLQFVPEAATLVQGNKLYDMKTLVEITSKSLPTGYKLVVKEHKVCVGRRPISFYKQILDFHNVELVDENFSIYKLIDNSSGVISISSTMGLEAMMMGKPIGVFGQNYYNHSSNVFLMHNLYEVEKNIKKMITHHFNTNDFLSLIKTILDSGFDGNVHPKEYTDIHTLPNISKYIADLEKHSA